MTPTEYEVIEDEYYARELNNRGFNQKKALTYKEYMACIIAQEGEWSRKSLHGYRKNDDKAWKSCRKTQYRFKKESKEKKRKPREQEHWRFKQHDRYQFGYRRGMYDFIKAERSRTSYPYDQAFSAIGFLENLQVNDYLRPKNADVNYYYDNLYKVCKVDYAGDDRDTVFVVIRQVRNDYLDEYEQKITWSELIKRYKQKKYTWQDRRDYLERKYPYEQKFPRWHMPDWPNG